MYHRTLIWAKTWVKIQEHDVSQQNLSSISQPEKNEAKRKNVFCSICSQIKQMEKLTGTMYFSVHWFFLHWLAEANTWQTLFSSIGPWFPRPACKCLFSWVLWQWKLNVNDKCRVYSCWFQNLRYLQISFDCSLSIFTMKRFQGIHWWWFAVVWSRSRN